MTDSLKWLHYDVARSRLLMRIGEVNHLIDQEQAASEPDALYLILSGASQRIST